MRKLPSLVDNETANLFTEMVSSGGKGRVPWTKLHEAQGDYILDKYLLAGVTLIQYHHIRLGDANFLLQHWTTRQAAGQIPFRFKRADQTTSREVSVGMGPSNSGIRNVQAQGGDGESQGDDEKSAAEEEPNDAADDPGPGRLDRVSFQFRVIYPPGNFSVYSLAVTAAPVAQKSMPRVLQTCRQRETAPIPLQLTWGPETETKRTLILSERYRYGENPREMAIAQLPETVLPMAQVQAG